MPKVNRSLSYQGYFRRALKSARGRAEQVIIVFVDVRGFSTFSSSRDSVDIGLYVRRLFLSLMDKYYPKAAYHKSTGDGMMVVYPYQEKTLTKIAKDVIESSLKLHSEFAALTSEDPMITFNPPTSCGIGINRGTVCCIESNDEILDYSGHVVNLAARLMDLARPAGIVMHASLGNLIPEEFTEAFQINSVYVRGIAENQPVPAYSLKGITSIPTSAMLPPLPTWGIYSRKWTLGEVKTLGKYFVEVPNRVSKPKDVAIRFYSPGTLDGMRKIHTLEEFEIRKEADKTEIVIDLKHLAARVKRGTDTDKVELEVKYCQ